LEVKQPEHQHREPTMTTTQTAEARRIKEQEAASMFTLAQQHRIGSRVTDKDDAYTLVAVILVDPFTIDPVYVPDHRSGNAEDNIYGSEDLGDTTPAPDDAQLAAAARDCALAARDYLTYYGSEDVLWDNPTSAEQILSVLRLREADEAWRIAEKAQQDAARERAIHISWVSASSGNNQSAAARLLGMDQSRVSRAVEIGRQATGHYAT
jgi:hypothetical protein